MKVHYLETVASDVDAVCAAYGSIGVRGPLRDSEERVVRPYWLVDDVEAALAAASRQGAFVAHPPREIPGKGTFAIYIQGDVNHGLWQL